MLAGPCGYGCCPHTAWGTSSPCGRAIQPPARLICVICLVEPGPAVVAGAVSRETASRAGAAHRFRTSGSVARFRTSRRPPDRTTRSNDEEGLSAGRPMTTSASGLDGTTAARRMASCCSVPASSCCWPTMATGRWPRLPLPNEWQSENGTSLGRPDGPSLIRLRTSLGVRSYRVPLGTQSVCVSRSLLYNGARSRPVMIWARFHIAMSQISHVPISVVAGAAGPGISSEPVRGVDGHRWAPSWLSLRD